MRTRYKERAVNYLAENFKNQFLLVDDEIEIKKIQDFVNGDNSYLEIGPGKGRFILDIAARNKDKKFLVTSNSRLKSRWEGFSFPFNSESLDSKKLEKSTWRYALF